MNTELRVGDAERDEVATALHEHFAQGRLTRDELDERLTATLSAKTVGDLREVTRDLPGPAPSRLPAERASGPWGHGREEMGAAHWGRGPFGPPWRGPSRGGWGPRHGRPFGPILLVALVVAAFSGWWVVFPLLACVWFAAAFTRLRYARRRLVSSRR
ncbi:MAG: DUF1707 SHOCT-like domain-containing protein [Actinoallomurus sp.]